MVFRTGDKRGILLATVVSGVFREARTHYTSFKRVLVELRRDGRGPILVSIAAGWLLSLGVRMIYPAVLPQLREAFEMDLTTAGLLVSTLWVAYALGQLPGGLMDDRFGGGRTIVFSTVVSAVAVFLVVIADAVFVLFGATVLFGLATALYGVARFTTLSAIYESNDGTAIALTMSAGDLGNTLFPPLAGFLAVTIAWQAGFAIAIPLFLVAAVSIYLLVPGDVRDRERTDPESADVRGTARRIGVIVRSRSVLLVFAVQTLGYWAWQGFTGLYPTYLVDVKDFDPATAAILYGGFFALGMVVKPIAGSAYDTYGLRRSLPVTLVLVSVGLAVVVFAESLAWIIVGTVLASSMLGYGAISIPYLTNSFPSDIRGSGLGTLRTCYMLIGAASPTVVGVMADADYFDEAFVLLAGTAAVAVLLSLLVPEQ